MICVAVESPQLIEAYENHQLYNQQKQKEWMEQYKEDIRKEIIKDGNGQ